jgi:hypothetical protein
MKLPHGVIMNLAGRPEKPAEGEDSSPSVCLAGASRTNSRVRDRRADKV